MFRIFPKDEQIDWVVAYLKDYDIGRRHVFNGSKDQQFDGLLGQICVTDQLGLKRPEKNGENDGGVDFTLNGKTWDVKTKRSHGVPMSHHIVNITPEQLAFEVHNYLFLVKSPDLSTSPCYVVGWLPKKVFLEKCFINRKGEIGATRDNGSVFSYRHDDYQISIERLNDIGSLKEIKEKQEKLFRTD